MSLKIPVWPISISCLETAFFSVCFGTEHFKFSFLFLQISSIVKCVGEEHFVQYCNEPLSNSGESTDHIWCQRAGWRHRTQRRKHLLPAPGSSSFCSVLRELEQPPGQQNSHAFSSEKSGFIKTKRTASPFNVWVSTVTIKRSCVLFHLIPKTK